MCVCVGEVGEREGRRGEGKEGGGERRGRGGEHAYTNGVVAVVSKLW